MMTIKSVEAQMKARRIAMARKLADGEQYEVLGSDLQLLAALEGKLHALYWFKRSDDGEMKATIREAAMILLTQSPSDTYSGRGNDLVRCFQDGVRDAVQERLRDE